MIVRSYSDDSDDRVLAEIQPKYIVMFEPNQDFVRRIEVRRGCSVLSNGMLMSGLGISEFESWA